MREGGSGGGREGGDQSKYVETKAQKGGGNCCPNTDMFTSCLYTGWANIPFRRAWRHARKISGPLG